MPRFADVPLGAALRVKTSTHMRYAMGDELNADVFDYDAGGDDGCPLLVLTPVCVNSASTGLGLCHHGVSTHRPALPAPLGAAVDKD